MGEASIPVNLFNPGQVFASLGFLEAADVLMGDAEGGFDWSNEADVRFRLRAAGERNPVEVTLEFLASSHAEEVLPTETAPSPKDDEKRRPALLRGVGDETICVGHWADGSSRDDFKQSGGQQIPIKIIQTGQAGRPSLMKEIMDLWTERRQALVERPFDQLRPMGGSLKFDARAAWKDRDVGYSLDKQKQLIATSPVVELVAAIGLEHSRPRIDERDRLQVKYGVWSPLAPPALARAALGAAKVGLKQRTLRFTRNASTDGYYKQVTFATEEVIQ